MELNYILKINMLDFFTPEGTLFNTVVFYKRYHGKIFLIKTLNLETRILSFGTSTKLPSDCLLILDKD
jgi:hypothetical protein